LLTPLELADWLDRHREAMADRWLAELKSRSEEMDGDLFQLLGDFFHLMTACLGPGMGSDREQVTLLFRQAAELYGNLGAHRGHAAGEAVEEFQILRSIVLRFLYTHPPLDGAAGIGLRDLLQLNRLLDMGVTYASIGHMEILFFNLFQGAGVADRPTPSVLAEVREQVTALREELGRILLHSGKELPPLPH
jgi:hypothetical protein